MKKIIALLCVITLGCSIIPDDAFEDIPQAKLKKITITSNTGKDPINPTLELDPGIYPTKTMIADAVVTEDKVTLELSGELDPIWFSSLATRLIYEINTNGLIGKISLTFESGITQTETLIYNNENRLLHMETNMETIDGDFNAIHDFYYIDGVLDSIAKRTWVDPDRFFLGYFRRTNDLGAEHDKFVSVFPFAKFNDLHDEENNICGEFEYNPSIDNNLRTSFYTFSNNNMRYESKIPIEKTESTAFYNKADLDISNMNFSKVLNKVVKFTAFNRENDYACGGIISPSLNYYSLLDPLNREYQILYMLMTYEEINSVYGNPAKMTRWADLTFEYEYNFTE